jgi:hypothetical protein
MIAQAITRMDPGKALSQDAIGAFAAQLLAMAGL